MVGAYFSSPWLNPCVSVCVKAEFSASFFSSISCHRTITSKPWEGSTRGFHPWKWFLSWGKTFKKKWKWWKLFKFELKNTLPWWGDFDLTWYMTVLRNSWFACKLGTFLFESSGVNLSTFKFPVAFFLTCAHAKSRNELLRSLKHKTFFSKLQVISKQKVLSYVS